MSHPLQGLEPQAVWKFFEEICAIPHGSRHTGPISQYLLDFAQAHGLRCRRDGSNNVVIFAPGTEGYEDHAPVILQGHMDMVCEKEPDCTINFETDGLDLTHDGTDVFAYGTTLGGDDGIAVAYALALLDSKEIPHPPLEVVITTDEEIGMLGAADIDLSDLKGRTLVNMDSEEEGILTVSCAGGATAILKMPLHRKAVYGPCWSLSVEGLQGGHSGQEINKNRANANKVMGELLKKIQETAPLCLVKVQGGAKDNAIPRSCAVSLVAMTMDETLLPKLAAEAQEWVRAQYDEPDAVVKAEAVEAMGGMAMSTEDSKNVADFLCDLPNGVQAMSQEIPGLVQTSLNLGIARIEEEQLVLTFSVRSSVNEEKTALLETLRQTAERYEGTMEIMGAYPAWEYRKDSPLRDLMCEVYREQFGKEPEIQAIHAGLECGLLSDKLPGLDCVSFGPEMADIHTSREKLNIASVGRMWKYLLEILRRL